VPGGIADRISLRFNDATAEPATIGIMDHNLANQVAREFDSIDREFCSSETPKTTNYA
jgi:hypothetical protein